MEFNEELIKFVLITFFFFLHLIILEGKLSYLDSFLQFDSRIKFDKIISHSD